MGLSKQQIKDHIASVSKNLQSEAERAQHGFEFAKLCFRVEEYESAIGYLQKYLTVNARDYRAQKWMGRLYEAVADKIKAVIHYERSLEIQPDQRNIVLKVADMYLGIDKPSKEALQRCVRAVERVESDHPLAFALYEKLQQVEGKQVEISAIENLLNRQLTASSPDPSSCAQLVKQYLKSGKSEEALKCCQVIDQQRLFEDALEWQDFSLQVAELHYQKLCGKLVDNGALLDCCVAVMRRCSDKFRLCLSQEDTYIFWRVSSEVELSSLILKFDRVLWEATRLVSAVSSGTKAITSLAVRELCGQLYLMLAQYLYVLDRSKGFVTGGSLQVPLADLCLLVSLNTTVPNLKSLGLLSVASRLKAEEWRCVSCARWSTVGWQLLSRIALCGRGYLEELTKSVCSKDQDQLVLVKELFGQHKQSVSFGDGSLMYDTKQSVIAADNSIFNVKPDLPALDDLRLCDADYVTVYKLNMNRILFRWLNYDVLGNVAPVSEWLEKMFPDLRWSTANMSASSADSLCRLDLEAYLVVQYDELKQRLCEKDKSLASLTEKSFLCSKSPEQSALWKSLAKYLDDKSGGVLKTVSLKKEIQKFLGMVRGHHASLEQLVLLARHFKKLAETVDAMKGDNPYSHRNIVKTLLQWTSHYWTLLTDRQQKAAGKRKTKFSYSKTEDADAVMAEAQFTLGKAALYNNDPSVALEHFSQVSTAQAAWNQAQILSLLADRGDIDPDTSMAYVRKAQSLIRTSSQPEFHELEDKLQKQEDEIKLLLKRSSMVAHMEYEDEQVLPVPQLHSTPAGFPGAGKLAEESAGSGDDLHTTLQEKDQQISSMMQQLQQLQDEVQELRQKASSVDGTKNHTAYLEKSSPDLDGSDMLLSSSCALSPRADLHSWPSVSGVQLTSRSSGSGPSNVSLAVTTTDSTASSFLLAGPGTSQGGGFNFSHHTSPASILPPLGPSLSSTTVPPGTKASTADKPLISQPSVVTTSTPTFASQFGASMTFSFGAGAASAAGSAVSQPAFQFGTPVTTALSVSVADNSLNATSVSPFSAPKPKVQSASTEQASSSPFQSFNLPPLPKMSALASTTGSANIFLSTQQSAKLPSTTVTSASGPTVQLSAPGLSLCSGNIFSTPPSNAPMGLPTISSSATNTAITLPTLQSLKGSGLAAASSLFAAPSSTTPLCPSVPSSDTTSPFHFSGFAPSAKPLFSSGSSPLFASATSSSSTSTAPLLFASTASRGGTSTAPLLFASTTSGTTSTTPLLFASTACGSTSTIPLLFASTASGSTSTPLLFTSTSGSTSTTPLLFASTTSGGTFTTPLLFASTTSGGTSTTPLLFASTTSGSTSTTPLLFTSTSGSISTTPLLFASTTSGSTSTTPLLFASTTSGGTSTTPLLFASTKSGGTSTTPLLFAGTKSGGTSTTPLLFASTTSGSTSTTPLLFASTKSGGTSTTPLLFAGTKSGGTSTTPLLFASTTSGSTSTTPLLFTSTTSGSTSTTPLLFTSTSGGTSTTPLLFASTTSGGTSTTPLLFASTTSGSTSTTPLLFTSTTSGSTSTTPLLFTSTSGGTSTTPLLFASTTSGGTSTTPLLFASTTSGGTSTTPLLFASTTSGGTSTTPLFASSVAPPSIFAPATTPLFSSVGSGVPSTTTSALSDDSTSTKFASLFTSTATPPSTTAVSTAAASTTAVSITAASTTAASTNASIGSFTIPQKFAASTFSSGNLFSSLQFSKSSSGASEGITSDVSSTHSASLPTNIFSQSSGLPLLSSSVAASSTSGVSLATSNATQVSQPSESVNSVSTGLFLTSSASSPLKLSTGSKATVPLDQVGYDKSSTPVSLSLPSLSAPGGKTGTAFARSDATKFPRLTSNLSIPSLESDSSATLVPHTSSSDSAHDSDVSTVTSEVSQAFSLACTESTAITSHPILSSLLTSNSTSAEQTVPDVIFLYEELPSPELVAKAKELMLPPSFYLYDKRPPCPGCRGCEEEQESAPAETKKLSPAPEERPTAQSPQEPPLPPQLQAAKADSEGGFSSAGMMSFSDIISKSSATASFTKAKGFTFQGTGTQLFVSKQDTELEGTDNPEAEVDIEFKPIVTLPDTYERKSWDDDAETLFAHHCKLFRFDGGTGQWKERGVGDIKIMKHRTSGKVRMIMRRDQILKICCNHYITKEMKLMPGSNEKSSIWFTHSDYSDETPKEEKMAVKFKHVETAVEFKQVFEDCVNKVEQVAAVKTEMEPLKSTCSASQPVGNWECEGCYISNRADVDSCIACGAPKQGTCDSEDSLQPVSTEDSSAVAVEHPADETRQEMDASIPDDMPELIKTEDEGPSKELDDDTYDVMDSDSNKPESHSDKDTDGSIAVQQPTVTRELDGDSSGEASEVCGELKIGSQGSLPYSANEDKDEDSALLQPSPLEHTCTGNVAMFFDSIAESSATQTDTEEPSPFTKSQNLSLSLPLASPRDEEYPLQLPLNVSQNAPVALQFPILKKAETGRIPNTSGQIINTSDKEVPPYPLKNAGLGEDDSVIFLYEELPSPELVAKAKELMLPPSFYLYDKQPLCPGCRGCEEEQESAPAETKKLSPAPEERSTAQSPQEPPLPPQLQAAKADSEGGFSSAGMMSFSDIVSKSSATASFTKAKGFTFQGTGTQLFVSKQDTELEGTDNPEAEVDIEFKPIVTLPDTYERKSWDDDAEALFAHRCKLFRFDGGTGQWKERGVGDIKIMKHRTSGKVRMIMRRDQILKICCNHYITKEMKLMPGSNEKSWIWFTHSDYSDETPKEEKMAVKFKHVETAVEFKQVFEDCVHEVNQASSEFEPEPSEALHPASKCTDDWECQSCYVQNSLNVSACIACGTIRQ